MFSGLAEKWSAASIWKKALLVFIIIPWTPIIMVTLSYVAPPEVVDVVNQNGKLVGQIAGESWKLASYFFATSAGL